MYLCDHVTHAFPMQMCECEKQAATERYAFKLVLPSPVAFCYFEFQFQALASKAIRSTCLVMFMISKLHEACRGWRGQ